LHSLGARAGVDFPYLLWQMVDDQTVENVRARLGLKWVHMVLDLAAAAGNIARGRTSLVDYIRSLSGISDFAVFSWDDLLPALFEIPLVLFGRVSLFMNRMLRTRSRERI
jgi:D-aspartate ligase